MLLLVTEVGRVDIRVFTARDADDGRRPGRGAGKSAGGLARQRRLVVWLRYELAARDVPALGPFSGEEGWALSVGADDGFVYILLELDGARRTPLQGAGGSPLAAEVEAEDIACALEAILAAWPCGAAGGEGGLTAALRLTPHGREASVGQGGERDAGGALPALPVNKLNLFGSRLKGQARPDSDIDLLVEFEPDREPGSDGHVSVRNRAFGIGRRLASRCADAAGPQPIFRDDVVRTAPLHDAA